MPALQRSRDFSQETIGRIRRIAREGGSPQAAMAIAGYEGEVGQFRAMCRKRWRIFFGHRPLAHHGTSSLSCPH